MKKYLFIFFLLLGVASAQDTCRISGTIYLLDGKTPAAGAKIEIARAVKNGKLFFYGKSRFVYANSSGVVTFTAPKTTGTDSAYILLKGEVYELTGNGKIVAVPNATTADLATLVTSGTWSSAIVAIPGMYILVGSDSLRLSPYTLAFSDAFQVGRDAYGRVIVRRDPDSSAAGAGITAATLKDSLNVETSIGARLANRIKDSLDANPRGSQAISDAAQATYYALTDSVHSTDTDVSLGANDIWPRVIVLSGSTAQTVTLPAISSITGTRRLFILRENAALCLAAFGAAADDPDGGSDGMDTLVSWQEYIYDPVPTPATAWRRWRPVTDTGQYVYRARPASITAEHSYSAPTVHTRGGNDGALTAKYTTSAGRLDSWGNYLYESASDSNTVFVYGWNPYAVNSGAYLYWQHERDYNNIYEWNLNHRNSAGLTRRYMLFNVARAASGGGWSFAGQRHLWYTDTADAGGNVAGTLMRLSHGDGRKYQVGAVTDSVLELAGGMRITGGLRLGKSPWNYSLPGDSLEAATKGYVDTRLLTRIPTDSVDVWVRPGALTSALASYATVAAMSDSLRKFPYGLTTPGTLGYAWKTLPGGAQGWAIDSAGAGASVDTARLLPVTGSPKFATGRLSVGTLRSTSAINANVHADSVRSEVFNLGDSGFSVGTTSGYAGGAGIQWAANSAAYIPAKEHYWMSQNNYGSAWDMHLSTAGNLCVGATIARMKLDVRGVFRATDTVRGGDYTTYTYFIPGGALVQSSTRDVKKNITEYAVTSLYDKVLAVNPSTWNFRESAFKTGYSETDTTDEMKAKHDKDDLERAAKLSQVKHTGFIAEDWAAQFGGNGKEMDQSEIIAVMWKTNQELIREVRALKARIEALEKK